MEVKFANPPLELGLKYHDLLHLTELKEKCSRIFKVQYSKPIRKKGKKNNRKGKQKKLGQKDWKLTAKELLKPLHLCKSGMMLQSLLVHYLFIMKEQVGSLKHRGHISKMPFRRDCSPMNHRTLSSNIYASTEVKIMMMMKLIVSMLMT